LWLSRLVLDFWVTHHEGLLDMMIVVPDKGLIVLRLIGRLP